MNKRNFFALILYGLFIFLIPNGAGAIEKQWRGNGGDFNISTAGNWVGGVAPTNGDDVFIGTTTSGTITWDASAPSQVRSITATSTFTLTLARGVEATSSLEINQGVTLTGGAQTITISGSGPNAFKVFGTFTADGSTITYTSTSTTDVASTTFATVNFNGATTYNLVGSTTATSTFTIASGATLGSTASTSLRLIKASGTGSSAPLVNNGTCISANNITVYAFQTGATDVGSCTYSRLRLSAAQTYTLAGSTTATSTIEVANGATLNGGGQTLVLTKSGTGTAAPLELSGSFAGTGSTVNYSFQTATTDVASTSYAILNLNAAQTYNLVGSTTATSTLTIANGATLTGTGSTTLKLIKASGTGTSAPLVNNGTFTVQGMSIIYEFQTDTTELASTTYALLTLRAAQTYNLTGSTTATSTVYVANGGTLGGTGSTTLKLTKASGTGYSAPLVLDGSFAPTGSQVIYEFQTGATDIASTTYGLLTLRAAATYNLIGSTTATSTVYIANGATLTPTASSTLYLIKASGTGISAPLYIDGTFTVNGLQVIYAFQTGATELASTTYALLTLRGAATYNLIGSTTATSTVTIASGATLGSTGSTTLTLIKASGTGSSAPLVNNGTCISANNITIYAFQTGASDIGACTFSALRLSAAQTYNLSGSTTATSTIYVANGATLSGAAKTLTLTKASGAGYSAPLVLDGSFSSNGSTVVYNFQTGATDISSTTYASLTVSGGTTYSLTGSSTATSTLTVSSGTTLSLGGNNFDMRSSGTTFTNNGTLTEGGTGRLKLRSGAFFADSSYARVSNYTSPGTMYLQVTDPDGNTNGTSAQTVTITVSSDNPSNNLSVTLTESGNATGIFRGSFATALASSADSGNTSLETNGNGTMSLSYTDSNDSTDSFTWDLVYTGGNSGSSVSVSSPASSPSPSPSPAPAPAPSSAPKPQQPQPESAPSLLKLEPVKIVPINIRPFLAEEAPKTITPTKDIVTKVLGSAGEQKALFTTLTAVLGRAPKTQAEFKDAILLAQGEPPVNRSVKAEKKSESVFQKLFGRKPDKTDEADQKAILMVTYGMRPKIRDLDAEKDAIKEFRKKLKRAPKTVADWNAVRALAYSQE